MITASGDPDVARSLTGAWEGDSLARILLAAPKGRAVLVGRSGCVKVSLDNDPGSAAWRDFLSVTTETECGASDPAMPHVCFVRGPGPPTPMPGVDTRRKPYFGKWSLVKEMMESHEDEFWRCGPEERRRRWRTVYTVEGTAGGGSFALYALGMFAGRESSHRVRIHGKDPSSSFGVTLDDRFDMLIKLKSREFATHKEADEYRKMRSASAMPKFFPEPVPLDTTDAAPRSVEVDGEDEFSRAYTRSGPADPPPMHDGP